MLATNWCLLMKIDRSIERKVFFVFGSFTFFLGLSFSIVSLIIAFTIEDAILEKILAHEANIIAKQIAAGKANPAARLDYMIFYRDLNEAPQDIREAKRKNPRVNEIFSDAQHHFHVIDVESDQHQVGWLVADVTEFLSVSSQSSHLLKVAIVLLTTAILFSLWLAYRIALRTTKPISNLANALEKQSKENSELDISKFKTGDEIEYLARTTESALKELKASLQRESDFNRDVGHELRTPLTIINNTLELSKQRGLEKNDQQIISDSANKITRIVKILLALARSETLPLESINLRAIVEESVLLFEQQLTESEFELNVEIPKQANVVGNPELILLLSNNLIENALRYATKKSLVIKLSGQELSFTNKGSSKLVVTSEIIIRPNIKQQDSHGIGQGLYLVSRIANRLNWVMSVEMDKDNYRVSFSIQS
jgi:signal transduction histidine kinase